MNVYLFEHADWFDAVLLEKLVDCHIQTYKIETDPLLENSLFIVEPNIIQELKHRTDIANIKNKKLLIIHHHKSFAPMTGAAAFEYNRIFKKLGFEQKNIYFITQLEYDRELILNEWPEINVLVNDRWLMQLFERQVIRHAYGFYSYGPNYKEEEITNCSNNLEMKRFSILIRRPDKNRFQFMCQLIANNLLGNFNYTFVNHTPHNFAEWSLNDFKKLIPEQLESSKAIIESWVEGIPYKTNLISKLPYGLHEHDDYPLLIAEYFTNSKINIVFETEPDTGASFLTEKTYKAMLYKKPFIIVTQKHGLKALRKGGYQTFGHVINESYDDIADYDERVQAILHEITRLNNLPEEEFNNLISSCSDMIEHNHAHLHDEAYKYIPSEFRIKAMTTF
jgi:hypothetical protein